MSIPERMPPRPGDPIGWSPNALSPPAGNAVQIANLVNEAAANQAGGSPAGGLVGGSSIVVRALTIPVASAQVLNATPYVVIPGQAGCIILPVFWWMRDLRGAVALSATPTWTIRHTGTTTTLLNSIALLAGASVAPAFRFSVAGTTGTPTQNDLVSPVGVGLELVANLGFTGGTGTVWTIGIGYGLLRV